MAPDFKVRPTVNSVDIVDISAVQTLTNKTLGTFGVTGIETFTTGVTHENATQQLITIADITSTQVLTVDVTTPTLVSALHTEFALTFSRSGNTTVRAIVSGFCNWRGTGGSTVVIDGYDLSYAAGAGTITCSLAAITGGFRITLSSTGYGNTLAQNQGWFFSTGFNAENIAITVTIT